MSFRQTHPKNGGIHYARRPVLTSIEECWGRLSAARDSHQAEPVEDQSEAILFALARAVEQRDRHTAGHCERIAFIGVALGVMIGLEQAAQTALYRAGFLHDVGKVGIPDSILLKPGQLTAEEWVTMRTHTIRGEEICRHLRSLRPVLPVIRGHHERWDGSGYPDGLCGRQIPLLARILQLADIYDALTSPRPYKPAFVPAEALRILEEETARGWRDPEIAAHFFRLHKEVLSKLENSDSGLDAMRGALVRLQ